VGVSELGRRDPRCELAADWSTEVIRVYGGRRALAPAGSVALLSCCKTYGGRLPDGAEDLFGWTSVRLDHLPFSHPGRLNLQEAEARTSCVAVHCNPCNS
jgi:hypothetical protein